MTDTRALFENIREVLTEELACNALDELEARLEAAELDRQGWEGLAKQHKFKREAAERELTRSRPDWNAYEELRLAKQAAERERDELRGLLSRPRNMIVDDMLAARRRLETRVAELEEALRQIVRAGVKFDAKGTHSERVVRIARAALQEHSEQR